LSAYLGKKAIGDRKEMKTKNLILTAIIFFLTGCSHPLDTDGNGDIISITSTRDCLVENQPCKNLVINQYEETYSAKPKAGYIFSHWEGCGDQFPQCSFNIPKSVVKKYYFKSVGRLKAIFKDESETIDIPTELIVHFPSDLGQFDGKTITLYGKIQDPDLAKASVTVSSGINKISAKLFSDGKFIARNVPLAPQFGQALVTTSATHSDGSSSAHGSKLISNLSLEHPGAAIYDAENSRILLFDYDRVIEVDTYTGAHNVIAKITPKSLDYRYIDRKVASALDATNNLLYFNISTDVYVINLATNITTFITTVDGLYLNGLAFDSAHRRLLVSHDFGSVISSIDLATKTVTPISSDNVGIGEELHLAFGIAFDQATQILYTFSGAQNERALLAINTNPLSPNYGDRATISDKNSPGDDFSFPQYPILDLVNNRVFSGDGGTKGFNEVSLVDGTQKGSWIKNLEVNNISSHLNGLSVGLESFSPVFFDPSDNQLVGLNSIRGAIVSASIEDGTPELNSNAFFNSARSFNRPGKIALDITNKRYFVTDRFRRTVWQIDSLTGERFRTSDRFLTFAIGKHFDEPIAITYIQNNKIIFATSTNEIYLLDLDAPLLSLISSHTKGDDLTENPTSESNGVFDNIAELAFVNDRNIIIALDSGGSLVAINSDNGDKTHIINIQSNIASVNGTSAFIAEPDYNLKQTKIIHLDHVSKVQTTIATANIVANDIYYDDTNKHIYVAAFDTIKRYDVSKKKWGLVTAPNKGSGTQLGAVSDMKLDGSSKNLYVSNGTGMLLVDTVSGNRITISR
jgi:hypothetical protein